MSNVLYYDNCWMTNIGEAFIDIGARKLLENIGDNKIIVNSTMLQMNLAACMVVMQIIFGASLELEKRMFQGIFLRQK